MEQINVTNVCKRFRHIATDRITYKTIEFRQLVNMMMQYDHLHECVKLHYERHYTETSIFFSTHFPNDWLLNNQKLIRNHSEFLSVLKIVGRFIKNLKIDFQWLDSYRTDSTILAVKHFCSNLNNLALVHFEENKVPLQSMATNVLLRACKIKSWDFLERNPHLEKIRMEWTSSPRLTTLPTTWSVLVDEGAYVEIQFNWPQH